jgi:hypothetical protein
LYKPIENSETDYLTAITAVDSTLKKLTTVPAYCGHSDQNELMGE